MQRAYHSSEPANFGCSQMSRLHEIHVMFGIYYRRLVHIHRSLHFRKGNWDAATLLLQSKDKGKESMEIEDINKMFIRILSTC